MSGVLEAVKTVPSTVPGTVPTPYLGESKDFPPPRSVLRAGPHAIKSWQRQQAAAAEIARIQAEEREADERQAVKTGLAETERTAKARKERVEHNEVGSIEILNRDGVRWLFKKGKLHAMHVEAALEFRKDWETAHGTGIKSQLNDARGAGGYDGASDAMLDAKKRVQRALSALGSPMLEPYVVEVGVHGEMLTSPKFGKDHRKASDHFLPCAIAFDLLARHYGMIR